MTNGPSPTDSEGATGAVRSRVIVNEDAADTLPAGSVARAVTRFGPAANAAVGVTLHVPFAATTVVSTVASGNDTRIVSPALPVPDSVGVSSLVRLSPRIPESDAASSRITGAAGPVVTIDSARLVAGETLPAGSVAVIDSVLTPEASSVAGVALQVPSAATIVVSTEPPGRLTRIVSPAVPVPEIVGVASLVMLSPGAPESEDGLSTAVGAAGAVASIVTVRLAAGEVFPAASVAVALRTFAPEASAVVGVTLHVPLAATVVVSTVPPGSVTRIVSPASPVPEIVGVVSLVSRSPVNPESDAASRRSTGAAGGELSMVRLRLDAAETLPAGSVAVTETTLRPLANAVVGVTLHVPFDATVVTRAPPPGRVILITSPAVPVPTRVGVVSLVRLSPAIPESEPGSSRTTGAAGALGKIARVRVTAGDTLPAGSVAVTEIRFDPAASAVTGVALQVPFAATVVVSTVPPGSATLMRSPAVPVPFRVGVASLVMLSPGAPESEDGARATVGASGAVVSIVNVSDVEGDTLPAGSVAVTVKVFTPAGNAAAGVTLHAPFGATVVVSTVPPGRVTLIESPALPVPRIVGVALLVRLSPGTPESEPAPRLAGGALGAAVSIVRVKLTAGESVAPPPLLATTWRVATPSVRALAGVADQLPLPSAVAVAIVVPEALRTVMVAFASAFPLIVGVLSLVIRSPWTPESLAGARTTSVGAAETGVGGGVAPPLLPPPPPPPPAAAPRPARIPTPARMPVPENPPPPAIGGPGEAGAGGTAMTSVAGTAASPTEALTPLEPAPVPGAEDWDSAPAPCAPSAIPGDVPEVLSPETRKPVCWTGSPASSKNWAPRISSTALRVAAQSATVSSSPPGKRILSSLPTFWTIVPGGSRPLASNTTR